MTETATQAEPLTIHLEWTPNPMTIKLVINRELLPRGAANFTSREAASSSPLALRLFEVPGVVGVMIGTAFVTLTKGPDGDWTELHDKSVAILKDHLESGRPILEGELPQTAANQDDDESVQRIKTILENEIRPAVAMDGGDIIFDRYEDGVLYLSMMGACSGCPSSVMTLRMGIENRLKQEIPALREVVGI